MAFTRRSFLRAAGVAAAGAAAGPLIRTSRAGAAGAFKAKRIIVVSVAGGLRLRESLGMAEGATMPSMLGDIPLVSGYGDAAAGAVKIAPEYAASMLPDIVVPAPRAVPLYAEGALVTNVRYAEGAPGHLQGGACLVSGAYNNIDNRADAHVPAPTLFELHRRQANTPATDAWYVSNVPGFYRALQTSVHPEYGPRFGGSWMSPTGVMTPIVPIVASGERSLTLAGAETQLPIVRDSADERDAVRRLAAVLDGNSAPYPGDDGIFRSSAADNQAIEGHLASIFADPTYRSFFPQEYGIGIRGTDGQLDATGDVATMYHAEQLLKTFLPTVMVVSLIDVDACHDDFNAYLYSQPVADACIRHLWDTIQSTEGLRDETALIVMPEHGRQLAFNGKNPDSLGRSGLDHGGGDDGDRDVWMLALGPDFKPGVYDPTGIEQTGRTSGRYETIDAVMTAATLLGYGEAMASNLSGLDMRPGLVMEDILA
ncbi:MAG: hypothetical protein WKG00_24025 [Polyangiaceae bacterium]